MRNAFAEGLEPLLDILADAIPERSKAPRRRKAVAAMAALVGALGLARATEGTPLSDEILDAARRELLAAMGPSRPLRSFSARLLLLSSSARDDTATNRATADKLQCIIRHR